MKTHYKEIAILLVCVGVFLDAYQPWSERAKYNGDVVVRTTQAAKSTAVEGPLPAEPKLELLPPTRTTVPVDTEMLADQASVADSETVAADPYRFLSDGGGLEETTTYSRERTLS